MLHGRQASDGRQGNQDSRKSPAPTFSPRHNSNESNGAQQTEHDLAGRFHGYVGDRGGGGHPWRLSRQSQHAGADEFTPGRNDGHDIGDTIPSKARRNASADRNATFRLQGKPGQGAEKNRKQSIDGEPSRAGPTNGAQTACDSTWIKGQNTGDGDTDSAHTERQRNRPRHFYSPMVAEIGVGRDNSGDSLISRRPSPMMR